MNYRNYILITRKKSIGKVRFQSALGSVIIPTVGTFYSQAGNVLFPTWEYLRALMVAIAGIKAGLFSARGHLLKNRWQLLADKSQVS